METRLGEPRLSHKHIYLEILQWPNTHIKKIVNIANKISLYHKAIKKPKDFVQTPAIKNLDRSTTEKKHACSVPEH
jgi:hypothetical protein